MAAEARWGRGLGRAGRCHGPSPRWAGASFSPSSGRCCRLPFAPAAGCSERSCLTKWRRAPGGGRGGGAARGQPAAGGRGFRRVSAVWGVGWGIALPPRSPGRCEGRWVLWFSPQQSGVGARGPPPSLFIRGRREAAGAGSAGGFVAAQRKATLGLLPNPWTPFN